jgi:UDPglucose 6-dehydrogenase
MREAPSLVLIENLLSAGAIVQVFDPVAIEEAKHTLGDKVTWCKDIYEAATGSDAIALVTEWNEFRLPEWEKVAELVNDKAVFDGRNIYDKTQLNQLGFSYYSIGKA